MSRLSFSPGNHAYRLLDEATGKKTRVPSVTTLLGQLAKPQLVNWAARVAADYAVDHWDDLTLAPVSQRREAIRTAHDSARNTAAAKGTHIHAMAEDLLAGRPVDVPPEVQAQVEGLARWLDAQRLRVVASERMVWSDEDPDFGLCGFAGTFDALVDHPRHGRCLVDWKTGTGVYPDMALQLAAYSSAEWWVDDDRDEPMPDVDTLAVAHVRPEGITLHLVDEDSRRAAADRFTLLRSLRALDEPAFRQVVA